MDHYISGGTLHKRAVLERMSITYSLGNLLLLIKFFRLEWSLHIKDGGLKWVHIHLVLL